MLNMRLNQECILSFMKLLKLVELTASACYGEMLYTFVQMEQSDTGHFKSIHVKSSLKVTVSWDLPFFLSR